MSKSAKSRRLVAIACLAVAPAAFADTPEVLAPVPVGPVEVEQLPDIAAEGTVTLRLPPVPAKAVKRAGKPHKAVLQTTAQFASNSVALKKGVVALDLKGPAPSDLSSGASLDVQLPAGSVNAQATTSVGRQGNDPAFWQKNAAQVDAKMAGPLGTNLSLTGHDEFGFTYRAPESIGSSDTASHMVRSENRSANASFSVPIDAVQVALGGEGSSTSTQDTAKGLRPAERAVVRTDDRAVFARAQWQPRAWLHVEGGADARTTDITWREQSARSSTYQSVDPHVAVSVVPWEEGTVTARVEHKVEPYDTAAFSGYAAVNPSTEVVGFQPNHAWQLQMQMEQKIGAANLSATYTAARNGSATEFADHQGIQVPASTRLDRRDTVSVALSMPLARIGLPDTELSSQAEWKSSAVLDPVTGKLRSASGEVPHKLALSMAHDLPGKNLSIGLTGEFTGARSSYQVGEVTNTDSGGSLGAFLKYKPGKVELDLSVNGLYGSSTESSFYNGVRGASQIGRTVVQDNSGPLFNLSLHKPL